jgi:hypothetical protein
MAVSGIAVDTVKPACLYRVALVIGEDVSDPSLDFGTFHAHMLSSKYCRAPFHDHPHGLPTYEQ